MDRPYVEELRIQNYGCIQDATFRLTPLHALIGPNNSGKSTVLRALATLAFQHKQHIIDPERDALLNALKTTKSRRTTRFEICSLNLRWIVEFSAGVGARFKMIPRHQYPPEDMGSWSYPDSDLWHRPKGEIADALEGAQLLRLDPDALRAPHSLIQDGQPLRFLDERGTGLPAIYDAIMSRDIQAFLQLNADISRLFPDAKSINLINPSPTSKALGTKLHDGTFVPAEFVSEGLLYYLAFAALPYTERTALLLVEEPENGLHPARIAQVMRILREISKTTQVIIATHNPLVVNELQPDEVTVVTRSREKGTKATLMKDTPNFEERSKVYALGELWLSYANGEDEAPLLQGGPRP